MKPKNLKEFKALIKRYESITLEEIKERFLDYIRMLSIAKVLTGFGSPETCTLCKVLCRNCVYTYGCSSDISKKTYERICYADTPIKLLNAFRARAKHMKTLI